VARRRHHRHHLTFQEWIRVLGLFASRRFALVRLVSVWVLLWVSVVLLDSPSSASVWVSLFVSFVLLVLLRLVFVWFHSFSLFLLRRVFVWFSLWVSSVVGSCVSIAGRTVMSHRRTRAQI